MSTQRRGNCSPFSRPDLAGEVEDVVDLPRSEDLRQLLVASDVGAKVVGLLADRDVGHLDVVAALAKVLGEAAADDAEATGDQDGHACS